MRLLIAITLLFATSCGGGDSEYRASLERAIPIPSRFHNVASFAAMHPKFPCEPWMTPSRRAAEASEAYGPSMAVLWGTFGDDESCLARFTAEFADRPHVLEVHFSNEAGRRNERLHEGEFQPGWDVGEYNRQLEGRTPQVKGAIAWRLARIEEMLSRVTNENTIVLISRGLEDNFSREAGKAWAEIFRGLSSRPLVASPVNEATYDGADYKETHKLARAVQGPHCVANVDGNYEVSREDERRFLGHYRHCRVAFLWPNRLQGLRTGEGFIPPRRRMFEFTQADIDNYSNLLIEATEHGNETSAN